MEESRLSDNMKLTVYRIVQEQCTNISKYAKATGVWLRLLMSPVALEMEIRDNGRGVVKRRGKGIGLKNIDARLATFNGTMQVQATKGLGFSLGIHLPLDRKEF
jgi:signal transduction histidine kinase